MAGGSTFDKIDWEWMADHIRIYAAYLWELCTAPVLPFEFVGVAEEFKGRIGELAAVGSAVGVDTLIAHADAFERAARQLDSAAKRWNALYRANATRDGAPAESSTPAASG